MVGLAWFWARHRVPDDGTLVVWTDTRGGGQLFVSIDQGRSGQGWLTAYMAIGTPKCVASEAAYVVTLSPGLHQVEAADDAGRRWRRTVVMPRRECRWLRLSPKGSRGNAGSVPADSG
jgi:hypothetical protein